MMKRNRLRAIKELEIKESNPRNESKSREKCIKFVREIKIGK